MRQQLSPWGRNGHLHVALAVLLAVAISAAGPSGPVEAKRRRVIRDSFQARAFPLPSPSEYATFGECFDDDVAPTGINTVRHRFRPAWDGLLIAEITSADGGWWLLVDDVADQGPYNSLARTHQTTAAVPLREGQLVDLVACNYAGAPQAEVRYEFTAARLEREVVRGPRHERSETVTYRHPSPGTVWPLRHEFTCFDTDCPHFDITASDRFIEVVADDVTGMDVAGMVVQWSETTGGYREDYFCTKTDKPVRIIRDATVVGAAVAIGPCSDGTPAMATTGEMTVTISNLR